MSDEIKLTLFCFGLMAILLILTIIAFGSKISKLEETIKDTHKRLSAVEIHSKGVKVKPRADSYKCPVCDTYLSPSYKKAYCDKCGTPLDWENGE